MSKSLPWKFKGILFLGAEDHPATSLPQKDHACRQGLHSSYTLLIVCGDRRLVSTDCFAGDDM
jgi:hypothetical protein